MKQATATSVVVDGEVPAFDLDDDDFIAAAMVVVVVKDSQGRTGIHCHHTPGMDWLQRCGALTYLQSLAVQGADLPDDGDGE